MDKLTTLLSGKKKILTMVLGLVTGLSIVFGLDQNTVNVIAGSVVAIGSVISYMVTEGKIDIERLKAAGESVNSVLDKFNKDVHE